jgi:ABC-2 type transport system permease protein
MAGLTQPPALTPHQEPWTAVQSRAQFAALAKLRWRIFCNNTFRRKGGAGELVARIILYPIIGFFAFGPIAAAGFGGYTLTRDGRLALLPLLTWAVFALWMLVLLNLAAPTFSFDINTIIRFPLNFARYLTARVFFGLLSASTVIGTLALIAADIGIGIARPSLLPWATLLLAIYALANIFFTRMMMVWVERWLSTRRAREILTALILFMSLGFQYLNVNFNPGFTHARHRASTLPFLTRLFHQISPVSAFLPPGLTATSIINFSQGRIFAAIPPLLGLTAFASLFFFVYAWRMHREFRGENLSQVAQPNQRAARKITSTPRPALEPTISVVSRTSLFGLNSAVLACLQKEFIYLRRNINQLYGFVAPIFMVFIFANRMSSSGRFGALVFPVAIAYSVLGVSLLSYNALGVDGSGVQLYFISPIRMRDVFLAKNLVGFLLNFIEFILVFAVIAMVAQTPSPVIFTATTCWLLFVTFLNGAVGNLRSITAPKKIDLTKASRAQASQLSVLLSMGILLVNAGIGFGTILLANYFGRPWLMIPVLLTLAIAAFAFYLAVLNRVDSLVMDHREGLAEELCKA